MIEAHRRYVRRIVIGLGAMLMSWSAAHADGYKIVSDDRIRLRVVEWRAADSQYASWAAVDGIYTVDDVGNLSLPVAGQIKAGGLTTDELSRDLVKAFTEKAGLQTTPSVALEIAEHAPLYVAGSVQRPGRYPFENEMTVMKAVSLAGGFLRSREDNIYLLRDQIQAAGSYRTALSNRRELLMRRARLMAEIQGKSTFDVPAELADMPNVEQVKADEMNLLRLRQIETASRITAADDVGRLYTQEIASLQAKIVSQKRQIDRSETELQAATGLMNKGVISSSRLSSLDRDLASAQGNLLDLEIALTRAKQTVAESERDKTGIVNQRNAENQQQLNTIEASLSRTSIDMQVAQMLGQQAGYDEQLSRMQAAADEAPATQRLFTITRRNDDGTTTTFPATGTTLLVPHDMLDIGGPDASDVATGSIASAGMRATPHLALEIGKAAAGSATVAPGVSGPAAMGPAAPGKPSVLAQQ
jgi:polysaccharide biosynthesis/export protein ExoF